MNRRTFFAAIGAAIAGAKAKVFAKPAGTLFDPVRNVAHEYATRGFKIGDTITIRRPQRFVIQDGAADLDMDVLSEMYIKPAVKSFADQMESELMVTDGWLSPKEFTRETLEVLQQSLVAGRYQIEPREPEQFFDPAGDIPLASSCECEEYEEWDD